MHKDKKAQKITGTGGSGKELVMGLLDRETGKVRVKHDREPQAAHSARGSARRMLKRCGSVH